MSTLPMKKVVLHEHGVGHFERRGQIEGDASLELTFRAEEMTSVLKSLTTLDLGNGRIASVGCESARPLARQLGDIALALPERNSVTALLAQLKGARVRVESGNKRQDGVLAGLEAVVRREGQQTVESHALSLLVDGQTLVSYDLLHVSALTFQDEALRTDLQDLLSTLIAGKKKDQKKLTIFAKGPGRREVVASYAVAAPVWKTSYRILLGTHMPVLQGWALVENAQDEDWEQVELTLVGEQFHHEIKDPVTVRRQQSALVPILQGPFEGRRVAVYDRAVREKNPMAAVLLKNTTGMTLEGGPVSVLEDESYVGEAMLETIKPGEEKLLPYSVELGCVVRVDQRSERLAVRAAQIANGSLHLTRHRLERTTYGIENRTDRRFDLFLEHRFRRGWELVDTERPSETTESAYRFRFDAAPRRALTFVVTERHDDRESVSLENVDADAIQAWLDSRYIDKATHALLDQLVKQGEHLRALAARIEARAREQEEIFQDQDRIRKNLGALGSSPDERALRERYVASLSRDEDRLREIADSLAKMKEENDRLARELAERIGQVRFAVTL